MRELAAFRAGTERVIDQLEREAARASEAEAMVLRADLWILRHRSLYTGMGFEEALHTRVLDSMLEMENRVRGEIQAGSTLAEVAQLYKWEKSS